MITIDKLDINVHRQYAQRMQMYEKISQQYRIQEASSIPAQTLVISTQPMVNELDMVLGVARAYTPWALFLPPKKFHQHRRPRFTKSRVAPQLGSTEKQLSDVERLELIDCDDEEEEEERKILCDCLKEVSKLNEWIGFIVGRIGQFLRG